MQRRRPNTVGVAIALVALGLQLAAAALHLPLALAASAGSDAQLAGLFDEHVLCRAADADRPAPGAPADQRPAPASHHFGLCCPWHGNASPLVPLPAAVEPIVFAGSGISFAAAAAIVVAARPTGTPQARAPPLAA